MTKKKILIVEDEPAIINLTRRILEREGFEVASAGDGNEALKILDKEHIDLLLTDIRMPGINGLELLKHFKERRPDAAAVIVTGYGTIETVQEAIRLGANGFVLKPFAKAKLLEVVNGAFVKAKLMHEDVRFKPLLLLSEVTHRMVERAEVEAFFKNATDATHKEPGADGGSIMLKNDEYPFESEDEKGLKKV